MPEISFFHKITSENYFIYFTNIVSLIPKQGDWLKKKSKMCRTLVIGNAGSGLSLLCRERFTEKLTL